MAVGVQLAFLGYCNDINSAWRSPLSTLAVKGLVEVRTIVLRDEASAHEANRLLGASAQLSFPPLNVNPATPEEYEFYKEIAGALGQSTDIDGIILDLPQFLHLPLITFLFNLPNFSKHLFSMNYPTLDGSTLNLLLRKHIQIQQNAVRRHLPVPIWTIGNGVKFESAVSSVDEILRELGDIQGGSISGSYLPGAPAGRKEQGAAYASLMQTLFGQVTSLSTADMEQTPSGKELVACSGWATFQGNPVCSFTILNTPTPVLDACVWGTLGRVSLSWDAVKQYFVVQRYLKHFEHPSLHPLLGSTLCLAAWIESIKCKSPVPLDNASTPFQALVDLSVADAMLASHGSVVVFKAVPLDSAAA